MNIGIVTAWFERGAALVSRAYMKTLSAEHNVFIYARGGEQYAYGDPRWDLPNVTWGKRVYPVDRTEINWPEFKQWMRQNKLDVVLFNEQRYWQTIRKCLKSGVLVGAYVDYYTPQTVPLFFLYDFLLCNTRRHHSVFKNHPQALYIPWGTDCDLFRPTNHLANRQPITFFHSAGMGGVNLRKGTDILVKAFQKVSGAAKLIIHSQVGVEHYGDAAHFIEADPRIEFINKTVSTPGLYHLGDVYVYPTKLEGIGLTIAEALACGLPVVTTDEAPMNEFVTNDVTGTLIPVAIHRQRSDNYYWPESICSEAALTEILQRYIDNPEIVQRQSQAARTYAVEHLNWSKNSQSLPAIIKTLKPYRANTYALRWQAIKYDRQVYPPRHTQRMFLYYKKGDLAAARHHCIRGLFSEPGRWRNLGTWSIGIELLLGRQFAAKLRGLARTVWAIE